MSAGWRVGADIGGTFTDIVALGPDGDVRRIKVPSTSDDYARGICAGLEAGLGSDQLRDVDQVVHGTTIATNAILEQQPPRLALITSHGFRDLLELRRSRRPTLYDLTWRPPAALVPRRLRLGVSERIAADGSVITPLSEPDVLECAARLRDEAVEAVAICLLNAHVNSDHEQRVAELITRELPGVRITLSSAIAPEPGEYERSSTTVVNGFLLPIVEDYLIALEASLRASGVRAPLQIMQSDGTTAGAEIIRERPFLIIESGPAAGVSAAARLAAEMGRDAIVTFDMGGTTAKASLVEQFRVDLAPELEVGNSINRGGGFMRSSGYLVRAACVDLTEVGSGGGSIAWIDRGGGLRVGPTSAGSTPGPACYDGGGTDATVTDAHVVLGYVNPTAIAGGNKPLRADLAHAAVGRLADQLGLSILDTAHGIFTIATATMRRAVRAVSVERGRDPRAHALVAFGGAGGLHAAALAAEMEMDEVVVPIVAGLFSSLGLLFADTAVSRIVAVRARLQAGAASAIEDAAAALARLARAELRQLDASGAEPEVEIRVSLRYVGQSSSLMLPYRPGSEIDALADDFHVEHRRTHGQSAEHEPVEVTAVRVRAFWPAPTLTFAEIARQEIATGSRAVSGTRTLYFGPELGALPAPIVSRASLDNASRTGPMVIEEAEATVLVPPGAVASLDGTGSVILRNLAGPAAAGDSNERQDG
jgi:N-methylhydantoinase A